MRSAIHSLVRTPTLALAIIATIALGVGATSAMFGVVYAVLLRPLPYRDAGRLVMVWEKWQVSRDMKGVDPVVAARLAERSVVMTSGLEIWRKENRVFEDIAGFSSLKVSLTGGSEPERIKALAASSSLFSILGVAPALGRAFTREEDQVGHDEVVVLSHALWMRRFSGDRGVLGKTVGLDGLPHTVVGVMPPGAHLMLPRIAGEPDLIVPIPHSYAADRQWSLVMTVARLKPGVTVAGAQADMSALVRRMAETNRRYRTRDANVVPFVDEMARDSRLALLVLFGATGCVLLIGCVNVANLLLVRAAGRSTELAIRTALGAGRWRLTSQVVVESVALAVVGGVAGLVLAYWGTGLLLTAVPENMFPRMEGVRVDLVVFAFGFGLSLLVGLAAGLAPAWHTLAWDRRGALNHLLTEARRTSSVGRGQRFTRRALVMAQVAMAMVLLVGAGLLTRTYIQLTRVDLGINPERVLTFGLTLPQARYKTPESLVALEEALLSRLGPLPGVQAVGLTNSLPVQATMLASMTVAAEGQPPSDVHEAVDVRTVSPGFFDAAGVRLAYGRLLTARDATSNVAVVNRVLVHRFWPSAPPAGPEPLGRRLLVGSRWCTIIGVVEDVRYSGPDHRAEQEAYVPLSYWPMEYVSTLVRTSGEPMALARLCREIVRTIDPDLPVQDVRTMEDVVSESVAPQRFRFVLIGAFAVLALALGIVGLYGVISQSVAWRAREMGIRMALGANRATIARMVLTEGLVVVSAGVVVGVAVSLVTTRVLANFLFGVRTIDAPSYAVAAAGILVLSAVAVYGPARRATRCDPISVLRAE
jgi:putative ABC transport system permease protein